MTNNTYEKIIDAEDNYEYLPNIQAYIEYLTKLGRKRSTIREVETCLLKFIKDGKRFEEYEDIVDFLQEHTVQKRSFQYYDFLLGFIRFNYADDRTTLKKIVKAIKMFGRRMKDPVPRNSIMSDKDLFRIILALKEHKHKIIAWIQKETGVRAGDVIRLYKKNVRFGFVKSDEGNFITLEITFIKKGDKVSVIPIFNPDLIDYVKWYLKKNITDEKYLFIDSRHKGKNPDDYNTHRANYLRYWRDLKQACEKCGYKPSDFATHDWRRNFANKVWVDVLKKTDVVALQRALGHSYVETTTKYLRQSGLQSRDLFLKTYQLSKK